MEEPQETPAHSVSTFPVVGVGASAGGLEALETFFEHMPPDSGMAFVVITHQHPGHTSLMAEILGKHTSMPVADVRVPTKVEPNHVYLAPPGIELGIEDGLLQPAKVDGRSLLRLPIDRFFRSLAHDQRERAIGVVLSGTGTDGTLGLKEIKGAAGMIMAQSKESARYAGMPMSAVESQLVDYVLPVEELPQQLIAYVQGAYLTKASTEPEEAEPPDALSEIFLLLRERKGQDFSGYKSSTTRRRIERRMNVHHLDDPADYVAYMHENPQEVHALFKELLIGVTSFFRDSEAFSVLAEQLPRLIETKPKGRSLRVWVPGCSTGEEAYSIAILLRECMEKLKTYHRFQIFATDLDEAAIEVARKGSYPVGIAVDVSPERLERFFVREDGSFCVRKDLRDHLVFAAQNLIADPPFTKLDLLSCRNLLIYLDSDLQQRLLPLFHYSLRPGGLLFLGSSESIGTFSDLFELLDKRWKVFRRKEVVPRGYLTEFPTTVRRRTELTLSASKKHARSLEEVTNKVLLERLAPPSVLVDASGEVVLVHGRTGAYLEPAPGLQLRTRVLDMAREGLRLKLAAAMRQAKKQDAAVTHYGVQVKSNGEHLYVDLRVEKLTRPESLSGLLLVSFLGARRQADPQGALPEEIPEASRRMNELARELQFAKETNQGTVEELETANEELKSTNEELQSTNEELQSANEELETSKEEMQSLNEELQTVNAELQGKVEELSGTTDDMKNLLNGTDIATIFLDNELRIKRYTDQATQVIRLIPSDLGRPIGDLVSTLRYDRLVEDAREVLRTLIFKEAEIRAEGDVWYLMRILPYRTADNVIEGLVLTFVDISKVKGLQEFERRLQGALENSQTRVYAQDADLRLTWASGPIFGCEAGDTKGKRFTELLPVEQAERLEAIQRKVLESGTPVRAEVRLDLASGEQIIDLYAEPVHAEGGEVSGVTCVATDAGDRP